MSTDIDDLPGPEEQQSYEQPSFVDDRTNQMANMSNNMNVNLNRHVEGSLPRVMNGNVTASIHKKPKEKFEKPCENDDSYYGLVMSYITKENMLLLAILYIACLRQSDEYTRKFLLNVPFNLANNSMASTIIKCIILLIIYLIVKQHI